MVLAMMGQSIPSYWLGIMLILLCLPCDSGGCPLPGAPTC